MIFKELLVATRYRINITCTTYYVQHSNLISARQRTTEEYIYYDTPILLYTSKLRSRPTWMCINSPPLSAYHAGRWRPSSSGCCGDGYPVLMCTGTGDGGTCGWNGAIASVGRLSFWNLDQTTRIAIAPSTIATILPIAIPPMAPIGKLVGCPRDTAGVLAMTMGVGVRGW